jgi:glycosyltransferase involved in cell wall biosynthesis
MSLISVIIPTWNRVNLVTRALDSVFAQHHLPDEVIVVDDGSTDNTSEVISRQFPEVKLFKQENMGVSAARNFGIQTAIGDWICLLDSDDTWQPEKLEKQLKALTAQPDYLLCHTNEIWIRNGKRVNQMKKHNKQGGYIFQRCLPLCVISPSSVMIHRNIFDDIGFFDEAMPACEDFDLWIRICARYPVLYLEDELITKYGGHEDQLSQQHWGMDRFRIFALEKIIGNAELKMSDRAAAIDMMLYKIDLYLTGAKKHGNTENVVYFQTLLEKYTPLNKQSTMVT